MSFLGRRNDGISRRRFRLALLGGLSAWCGSLLSSFGSSSFNRERASSLAWARIVPRSVTASDDTAFLIECAVAGCIALAILAFVWSTYRRIASARRLHRPYELRQLTGREKSSDLQDELAQIITWLQEECVIPLDKRLPGRPFEYDIHAFPFTPMVLVIGNHSSGKSTFINSLLGVRTQETGVAPTDDGFTVLERDAYSSEIEDGPTLLGCTQNRPYRELQRFGRAFSGHLKRKRLLLPETSVMPYGLQIVDSPGMIDLPANDRQTTKARGYNFVEVVRWWACRADLILLLFDPDKPGTTGETLEVLTKSLAGLDHKFLVVLNKMDQLDNAVDFARAYGTLGWALSKVIPQKDIPQVWTMYNEGAGARSITDSGQHLPLEAFRKKRDELVTEVLRAKVRHWDNVITQFSETLRQVEMVATVSEALRRNAWLRMMLVRTACGILCAGLGYALFLLLWLPVVRDFATIYKTMIVVAAALLCGVLVWLSQEYLVQSEFSQMQELDSLFEAVYADAFVHTDAEDLQLRWRAVRTKVVNLTKAVPNLSSLPRFGGWEVMRINECLEQDVWYLRTLAKQIREPDPIGKPLAPPPPPKPRQSSGGASSPAQPPRGVSAQVSPQAQSRNPPAHRSSSGLSTIAEETVPPVRRLFEQPGAPPAVPLPQKSQDFPTFVPNTQAIPPACTPGAPPALPLPQRSQDFRTLVPNTQAVPLACTPVPEQQSRPPQVDTPSPRDEGDSADDRSSHFECLCGYSCGTASALQKHLSKNAGDPAHGKA